MAEVDQETIDLIVSQIKSMEVQLAGLRAQVQRLGELRPVRTFADLHGILPELDLSEEEIDEARYRCKWEGDEKEGAEKG